MLYISFIPSVGVFESCVPGVLDSGFRKVILVPLHASRAGCFQQQQVHLKDFNHYFCDENNGWGP
jgi:hypothetical protein